MTKISLNAEKRDLVGKKVKKLREQGQIPANVFGKKIKSESISVDKKEFNEAFQKAGETQIIDLSGRPVLVSNVQNDPLSGEPLHIDFRQVDLTEKISANVPVVLEGESPAEKQSLGTVVQQIDELEVEALPTDLPEKIVVDQSILSEVDQAIYVKDLKISSKVTVINDGESIVAKVEPQQEEEPEPVVAPAEGEAEATGEATDKPEEGDADKKEESKE